MAPSHKRQPLCTLFSSVAVTALSLGLVASASAQTSTLEPTFGTVTEPAGFGTNTLTIQAGGAIDASSVAPDCTGFIADAPDVVFDYGGEAIVLIEARSEFDTTMLVEAPDGQILCNDDFDGLNPGIETAFGEPGRYAIWVGTFDPIENDTYPDADLVLSELTDVAPPIMPSQDTEPTPGPGTAAVDITGTPTFGRVTLADLANGHTLTLQAGGPVDAAARNAQCAGFIAEVPDFVIDYTGAPDAMDIAITSDIDTTLLVVSPDGRVWCNDDAIDLNPGLTIPQAAQGAYSLFVGTFDPIENDFYPDATVAITQGAAATQGGLDNRARQTPTFGTIDLAAAFASHTIDLQAGGALEGSAFGQACNGFVADAPDYTVTYAGSSPLQITSASDADTTMVVALPNGQTLCNDDFSGLNAGLVTPEGLSGPFAIWVGTFDPIENDVYPAATLTIREVSASKDHPEGAVRSTALTAGFTPDPFTTQLAAGGLIDASTVDDACWGFIASEADFTLDYTSGDWPLRFFVTADTDTTLMVRTPSGDVLCNDDSDGLNPALALADPPSGRYEVFIGTYDPEDGNPTATLAISELVDQKELPSGAPTDTAVTRGMTRQDFELLAGGSFEAFSRFGDACNGFVAVAPDFTVLVEDEGVTMELTARSAEDTTLAVRTPSGAMRCDDDTGGDFNPLVLIESTQVGAYEVWLGTFTSAGHAPATLSIRDVNAGTVAPNIPGGGKK